MLCRTCEILSCVSSCPPHRGPAVNPAGARPGAQARLLEQLEEELTPLQGPASSTSAGNPLRSRGLHVGHSRSQPFKKMWITSGLHFLHIAKASIPEIPKASSMQRHTVRETSAFLECIHLWSPDSPELIFLPKSCYISPQLKFHLQAG